METVKKLWGREEIIENNKEYCLKKMVVEYGYECSIHYHKMKKETFYILEGELCLEIYVSTEKTKEPILDKIINLGVGNSYTIDINIPHRFYSRKGRTIFMEASMHDDVKDSIRLVEARKRD